MTGIGSDEALKLLVDIQVGHPYIFIAPQRLERIAERIRKGQWNERSEAIHNMTRNFKRIRTKARVDKCTIHDLRKSAITNWSKKLPIQVTRKLAGHSNIKTTLDYYLAVRPEDFKAAGEVFNEILQGAENWHDFDTIGYFESSTKRASKRKCLLALILHNEAEGTRTLNLRIDRLVFAP